MSQADVVIRPRRRWFGVVLVAAGVAVIVCCATVVLVLQSRAATYEGNRRMQATSALAQVYVREQTVGLAQLVQAYAGPLSAIASESSARLVGTQKAQLAESLEQLQVSRPDIISTFLTDAHGKLLGRRSSGSTALGTNFAYRDWFAGALRTGRPYISEVYQSKEAGRPFVVAASVVVHGRDVDGRPGPVVGVLAATYALSVFQKFVDDYAANTGIRLVIVDQRGALVAAGGAGLPPASSLGQRRDAGRHELTLTDVIAVTDTEPTTGWTVSSQIPTNAAIGSSTRWRGGVLAVAGILIVLVLAAGGVAHRLRRARLAAERRFALQQRRGQEDIDRFFSISLDLLCIAGLDGYFKQVNPAWQTALGWDADELLSRPFTSFVHPDDLAKTQGEVANLAGGPANIGFENRYRCKDGSYRWLLWRTAPDLEHGLLYAVARDITEQKRSEQAAAWLAAIVESSIDAIVGADLDGTITSWNSSAERMFGYPAAEIVGRSVLTLASPASLDHEAMLLISAPGESTAPYEATRLCRDGRLIEVSLSKSVVRDQNGDVVGVSRIARDITDARRSAETLQAIIDTAGDAYVSVDDTGAVTEWNHRAEVLFGWTRADVTGRNFERLILLEPSEAYRTAVAAAVAGGGADAVEQARITARHRDGTEIPVEITLWQVAKSSGEQFSAFLRDVSQRQQFEREMAASRDEAVEGSRLKSEFLATMSHEIRTPMNAVIGLTGLLLRGELEQTQRRYAESIRVAGSALLSMINDILDLSKIEAGGLTLDNGIVSLSGVLEEVLELVAQSAHGKGLELVGYCDQALPSLVRGDSVRIRQILLNLAANAVKFTEHGEVFIHIGHDLTPEPHQIGDSALDAVVVRMEVIDTGIGIPFAQQARLFDAFAQADSSATRRFGGTGLGLSICRELAGAMGGRVGVQSTPDVGSTFWCTLPLSYDPAVAAAAGIANISLKGLRVLVADAHATSREVLTGQTRAWSMLPAAADSGDQAVEALTNAYTNRAPFDMLILDAGVSVTHGRDLRSLLNHQLGDRPMPVILITSRDYIEPEGLGGIVATLTRPVQQSELYDGLIVAAAGFVRPVAAIPPLELPVRTTPPIGDDVILLVEDNVTNQMVAVGILTELGYRVDVASDGMRALQMLSDATYLAVLMDCEMPVIDGYETTREIRRREAAAADQPAGSTAITRIPIIAMTAAALKGDRERCLAAGMDDYLSKPFEPEGLVAVLHRWLIDSPPMAASVTSAPATTAAEHAIADRLRKLRAHVPPGTVERLLTAFVDDGTRCLAELNAALTRDDATAVARAAHNFRGAAATIGAAGLGELCASLEALSREHRLDTAPEILARLQGEYDTTRALLERIVPASGLEQREVTSP